MTGKRVDCEKKENQIPKYHWYMIFDSERNRCMFLAQKDTRENTLPRKVCYLVTKLNYEHLFPNESKRYRVTVNEKYTKMV